MAYAHREIEAASKVLLAKFDKLEQKRAILRAPELAGLYEQIKTLPAGPKRAGFGKEVNKLKTHLEELVRQSLVPKS